MTDQKQTSADELQYNFKPSLLGSAWQFRLERDALAWTVGSRSGRIPYRQITRVRLSFRPMTMQSQRFVAEIWSSAAPKLQIASTSWKSMVEQERLDADYRTFITELHRRLAAAGTQAAFVVGYAAPIYWAGVAVFVATAFGLAGMVVRAVQLGAWASVAFIVVFFGVFVWQVGSYFQRNRPGSYRPEALPAAVLPRP
jgi:hypothetical protein